MKLSPAIGWTSRTGWCSTSPRSLRAACEKRDRDPANFDVNLLAAKSEGYVGAEIEQAIIDAMYLAFSDQAAPGREFTSADILTALGSLVPLSRSQHEHMDYLRSWVLEGRALSASRDEEPHREADVISLQPDQPRPA